MQPQYQPSGAFNSAPGDREIYFLNTDIDHVAQQTNNDCGVACLMMAIKYIFKGKKNVSVSQKLIELDQVLVDLRIKNKSLWTIDSAHVCSRMNLEHVMFTVNMGVQDTYAEHDFYTKDQNFNEEKRRIEEKFNRRADLGLNIIKQSVELDRIKSEICRNAVCIVLIDANRLNGTNVQLEDRENVGGALAAAIDLAAAAARSNKEENSSIESVRPACQKKSEFEKLVDRFLKRSNEGNENDDSDDDDSYRGHFIVLIGYDDERQLVYYRNPSATLSVSYASYANFEAARKSFGTDEDILFIYPPSSSSSQQQLESS